MDAFDEAIDRLKRLPGIGKKSARRLVFHLISVSETEVQKLSKSLLRIKDELGFCDRCHSLAERKLCNVCRDPGRDESRLCVVSEPEDVFTIEDSGDFSGQYHVLKGLISPLDGVGPEQLTINSLLERLSGDAENINEVIFAFNPTNEGEVTMNYLKDRTRGYDVELSHLGYGLPVGSDIEYTDEMTLSKALQNRVPLERDSS
jgi:recombination protein RecR